jgi:hypothetical protein
MKITHHAAKRFLERVIGMKQYGREELRKAYRFLKRETDGIQIRKCREHLVLPSFKEYQAIVVENTLVTIVPKRRVA